MSSLAGKDRLIFALDVPDKDEARRLVKELDGVVSFHKIGLELLMSGGFDELLRDLVLRGKVFVDLKLPGDIPETVRRAVRQCATRGVTFLTLSSSADERTIRDAVAGRGGASDPRLLFVTYLSSRDATDHAAIEGGPEGGFDDFVAARASRALHAGCDGLIASGASIGRLRKLHPGTIIVSPGIRPSGASSDDHKRLATPAEAIRMGADYLVVGRPIRDASDRRGAAKKIIEEIDEALAARPMAGSPRVP